ncbi:glycerophosphodiester phosphodiesterase [Fredinandcohnia sp. 179-A 10B2 NHS]|uniref:glycerophosphodiester phosphodiesterase n=1 Tax=Fredinandcohnia sp. 179-A 10B2 NHS TaxID=3235176 RepID=UPI0039A1A5AD
MTTELVRKNKKPKKSTKILSLLLLIIVILFLSVNLLPVKKQATWKPFDSERPLVIAHQGGEQLAPSNTMEAFTLSKKLGVDVLEFDIHITKDGHLVTIHDPTVDRTTNGKGAVADFTLKELQDLDAGYSFQDLEGEYSFRGKGAFIPSVKEVFEVFPDTPMIIEIKDDNPPERMKEVAEKLWLLIEEYNKEEQVIVASFDQAIIDTFQEFSKGKTPVAAGRQEVTKFVVFHKFFLRNLYQPQVDFLHIPTSDSGFDLADQTVLKGAHRRGVDIHYWTINDKETMQQLIESGADGIMTDRPDLMIEVLEDLGY